MGSLKRKAFTLIELLVVIAIIGILSALIIIGMSSTTQKATIAKAQVFSNSLRNSLMGNLVSEWKLDDASSGSSTAATDSWNGINNGVLTNFNFNTTDGWRTGADCVSGNCLLFDGVNDYVDCGDNDVFSFGNSTVDYPFSLSVWVKAGATGALLAKATGSNVGEYYILQSGTNLYFRLVDNSLGTYIGVSFSDSNYLGKWMHITATYNGNLSVSGIKIYVNGTQQSVSDSSLVGYVAMENTAVSFKMGLRNEFFDGSMDDVRVYNAAVPTSQIQQNYFAGLNKLFAKNQITKEEYNKRFADLKSNYAKE